MLGMVVPVSWDQYSVFDNDDPALPHMGIGGEIATSIQQPVS